MTPDLFTAKNIIVQGITGTHGRFQTKSMLNAGTNVVAGTTPGKAGQLVENVPVYNSIADIQQDHTVDTTIIFVPAPFAKGAIMEAITAKVPLIVCITEGIPIHDMIEVRARLAKSKSILIGPNCPGVIMPGINKLGIIPASMSLPGHAAIVSRSGTLTYEAMAGLTAKGIGQRYVIGIGGDSIRGTGFVECLKLFENDPEVDCIVLIGEIGGTDEQLAADYIAQSVTKPVFAYVAGQHAPVGVQLGHAGAILGSNDESASAKTTALQRSGAHVASNISALIDLATTHQRKDTEHG
jgi:succinyl-CoA synthetase alpha subunit